MKTSDTIYLSLLRNTYDIYAPIVLAGEYITLLKPKKNGWYSAEVLKTLPSQEEYAVIRDNHYSVTVASEVNSIQKHLDRCAAAVQETWDKIAVAKGVQNEPRHLRFIENMQYTEHLAKALRETVAVCHQAKQNAFDPAWQIKYTHLPPQKSCSKGKILEREDMGWQLMVQDATNTVEQAILSVPYGSARTGLEGILIMLRDPRIQNPLTALVNRKANGRPKKGKQDSVIRSVRLSGENDKLIKSSAEKAGITRNELMERGAVAYAMMIEKGQ